MIKKVYVSGAITGDKDYEEKFLKAEGSLICAGFIPVNPAKVLSPLPEDTTWEQYIEICVSLVKMCDAVYLLNGWENSRGAKMEKRIAEKLKKVIIFEGGEFV